MNDLINFRWRVPKDGYHWIQAGVHEKSGASSSFFDDMNPKSKPQWVLTDGLPIGLPYDAREYALLEAPTSLHRTFAGIPADDRDAILEFADEYGMLGVGQRADEPNESGGKRLDRTPVETWASWKKAIKQMRRAVSVWGMVTARDRKGLARCILWKPGPERWYFESHIPNDVYLERIEPVENLFRPGNVLVPAAFLVQRWINANLAGVASPRVLYDLKKGRRVLRVVPHTLLAAMWLQFAQTVDGAIQHRACKECGTWFEISTGEKGFRINRQFCSDACKSRDYRRKKKARVKRRG
jgi:hypothetical protein